jgi:hypothetical protein
MARPMSLLLAAISALTFALSTPALALNPQPLPPGLHHSRAAHPAFRHGTRGQHQVHQAIKQNDFAPLPYSPQWGGFR